MVGSRPLRVVFFGTPAFAVPTLDALLASRHTLVAAISQPDRPHGRGQKTSAGPVKARAAAAGLPVLQPTSLKDPDFLPLLAGFNADVGVVAAYGKILTDAVLATPRLGMVNVHASLLPRYRGAAPIHRAVIAGERETGVTIMRVVKALDAGPMLDTVRQPIGPEDTSADIERELAQLGAALLVSVVDRLDTIEGIAQNDAEATYASRLTKADGVIHWAAGADQVHNLIRGLHPWPHAYTFHDGMRLILLRSSIDRETADAALVPGTIVKASGDDLRVACGDGAVRILSLQAENTRPMAARDFLAGHRLSPGAVLTAAP